MISNRRMETIRTWIFATIAIGFLVAITVHATGGGSASCSASTAAQELGFNSNFCPTCSAKNFYSDPAFTQFVYSISTGCNPPFTNPNVDCSASYVVYYWVFASDTCVNGICTSPGTVSTGTASLRTATMTSDMEGCSQY
jgi:hypothetical protein